MGLMGKLWNNYLVHILKFLYFNRYDFTLVTLMVVDEYGEGFPVAWCFSNKEDHTLLSNFYEAIKRKVGALTPLWFMSDLAEQFYSAWIAVFTDQPPPKRLYCV